MRITITVDRLNIDDIKSLQDLADSYFPNQGCLIEPTLAGYELRADEGPARFLFDQLRIASEDPAFQNYTEWLATLEAQGELQLGEYSPDNPIHATAG